MSSIRIDAPFELRAGEAASIAGFGTLKLLAVRNDSRCPQDVTCIWAGDALLDLRLTRARGKSREIALSVRAPSIDFDIAQELELTLVELYPLPRNDASIDTADYRATLKLTRRRTE